MAIELCYIVEGSFDRVNTLPSVARNSPTLQQLHLSSEQWETSLTNTKFQPETYGPCNNSNSVGVYSRTSGATNVLLLHGLLSAIGNGGVCYKRGIVHDVHRMFGGSSFKESITSQTCTSSDRQELLLFLSHLSPHSGLYDK